MRRGGAGKRRDQNEPGLIAGWRAVGAEVWQISGTGLPDVLVRFRGTLYAFEIKTAAGTLTEHQGNFPVIRTMDQGLLAIGAVSSLSMGKRVAASRPSRGTP